MCRDAYRANATDDDFVKAATRHGEHGDHGAASCGRDLLREPYPGVYVRRKRDQRMEWSRGGWPRAEKPGDKVTRRGHGPRRRLRPQH